jgi:hypothetical protein
MEEERSVPQEPVEVDTESLEELLRELELEEPASAPPEKGEEPVMGTPSGSRRRRGRSLRRTRLVCGALLLRLRAQGEA